MSFSIVKKGTRRAVGIAAAIVFTGTIILGFITTYKDTKNKAVPKVNLVQAAIYAEQAGGVPVLYEAVAGPECIREIAAASSSSSVTGTSSSVAVVAEAQLSSVAKTQASVTTTQASTSEPSIEMPLVNASSPTCLAQITPPEGYVQLGAEGFVTLALNLAATGRVERGDIEKSSGFPELDAAAVKQVTETWQFLPCQKAGEAVACRQYIRFRWQIQ